MNFFVNIKKFAWKESFVIVGLLSTYNDDGIMVKL